MRRLTHSGIAFIVLLLAVGCGDDAPTETPMATEPMTGKVAKLGDEIGEMEQLVAAHDKAIKAAADLAAVTAEQTTYAAGAEETHEHMHEAVEHMGECQHDGHGPHTDGMMTLFDDMDTEMMAHGTKLSGAADLAAAQAEGAAHVAAMTKLLGDLKKEHDEVAAEAAEFMCPMEGEGHGHE